jgi:hypothetical protein
VEGFRYAEVLLGAGLAGLSYEERALCINQTDNDEKSLQVGQMGDVYKHARNTIIYLGEATEESDLLLHSMRSPEQLIDKAKDDQAWRSFLERPWFMRIWIYQELMLSSDPWVQCGNIRVRWHQLDGAIHLLQSFDSLSEPWRTFESLARDRKTISDLNATFLDDITKYLLRIVESRRGLGVSGPQDMLFAHLGIFSAAVDEEERTYCNVDYGKELARVYEDVVKYYIMRLGDCSILSYVFRPNAPGFQHAAASWAPDWTVKSPSHPFRRIRDYVLAISNNFDEAGRAHFLHFRGLCILLKANHIWLSPSTFVCIGFVVGTISKISETITESPASWNIRGEMKPELYFSAGSRFIEHWTPLLGSCSREIIERLLHAPIDAYPAGPSSDLENLQKCERVFGSALLPRNDRVCQMLMNHLIFHAS